MEWWSPHNAINVDQEARIISVSKWLVTMVSKSPKDRVVGPLPHWAEMAEKMAGY